MQTPNTNIVPTSLQQHVRRIDLLFKSLDEKAIDKIKNNNQDLEDVSVAIKCIRELIQQFLIVVRHFSDSSMETVGLNTLKEAYCDFTAAKRLLDYHMNNISDKNHIDDLKKLEKMIDEDMIYYKNVKDYISKSASSNLIFQSDVQSRFNMLLNGGNPIIEKSKLIENIAPLQNNSIPHNPVISSISTPNNISTPAHPPTLPNRPRSISPSPPDDPDLRLLNFYSLKGYVDVEKLLEIYHKFDDSVLLIDFRPEMLFDSNHISLFSNIVNIDPVSVKSHYIIQDIIDHSLLLSSTDERKALLEISKFNLVIIIDQCSIHSRLSLDLLRLIVILDEKNIDPRFKLQRKPIILDGGFDEWSYFMNNQSRPPAHASSTISSPKLMSMSYSLDNQQNYIHTQPSISRSPSPIRTLPLNSSSSGSFSFFSPSQNQPQELIKPLIKLPISSVSSLHTSMGLTRLGTNSPNSVANSRKYMDAPNMKVGRAANTPILQVSSINVPSRSSSPARSPILVSGLYNLGNSCYMNASLQCMIGTKELTNYLLQNNYQQFVAKDSKLGSHGRLTNEYQNLAKLMLANTAKHVATDPKKFKKVVGSINSSFDNCDQQDSAEFLHFILDTIHEDLNWSANNTPFSALTDAEEENREILPIRLASTLEWERYLKTDYSSIIEIFSGQYASRLECNNCYKTSTTYIPFNMLSVPIPEKKDITLYDCIDNFVLPEILKGDNAWKCSRCKESRSTKKQLKITRLPRVLIIHLERFSFSGAPKFEFVKNSKKVDIPLKLEMKKYWPQIQDEREREELKKFPPRGQDGEWEYKLYGVVRHYGTLNGGHYISEVNKNGKWIKFDDDKLGISENVGRKDETDGSAYILFYEKVC